MTSRDRLKAFMATPWFRVFYLVLIAFFVGWMFAIFAGGVSVCLSLIVISLTMFVVPFWFRERSPRRFFVNGLVMIAIALVVLAGVRTQIVLAASPVGLESFSGLDPTMTLRNGSVTPFHAEGPAMFVFRLQLFTTENATASQFRAFVNLTVIDGLAVSGRSFAMTPDPLTSSDTRNGSWFTTNRSLGTSVYGLSFAVERNATGNWTFTPAILAPIAAPAAGFFAFFVIYSLPLLAFALLFYFFIVFLWWYSGRMRRTRSEMLNRAQDMRKESPRVESGKAGKAAAFTCTNCGADVTEDASSCSKCGAVFED